MTLRGVPRFVAFGIGVMLLAACNREIPLGETDGLSGETDAEDLVDQVPPADTAAEDTPPVGDGEGETGTEAGGDGDGDAGRPPCVLAMDAPVVLDATGPDGWPGRVVAAGWLPDGALGLVSDPTNLAWGFDTAFLHLRLAPGAAVADVQRVWDFGHEAVGAWSGAEFAVATPTARESTDIDFLRIAPTGELLSVVRGADRCSALFWTGSDYLCARLAWSAVELESLGIDGTPGTRSEFAAPGQVLGAAWGSRGLGIAYLSGTEGPVEFAVVDRTARPVVEPHDVAGLEFSPWSGLRIAADARGFVVLHNRLVRTEHHVFGVSTVDLRRTALDVLFLSPEGGVLRGPVAIDEALTYADWDREAGPPVAVAASEGGAFVAWRHVDVVEDPAGTPPHLDFVFSMRFASLAPDGTVGGPVVVATHDAYYGPTLAVSGTLLAVTWAVFCVSDGPDCIAVWRGRCE